MRNVTITSQKQQDVQIKYYSYYVILRKQPPRPIAEIFVRIPGDTFMKNRNFLEIGFRSVTEKKAPGKMVSVRRKNIHSWKISICSVKI